MTKRRIERKIEELEHADRVDDGGILIACEHDDGTITDPDGEPVTAEMYKNANIVIDYVSRDVADTWPDLDDDIKPRSHRGISHD